MDAAVCSRWFCIANNGAAAVGCNKAVLRLSIARNTLVLVSNDREASRRDFMFDMLK